MATLPSFMTPHKEKKRETIENNWNEGDVIKDIPEYPRATRFLANGIDNTKLEARKPKIRVSRGTSDESYEENDIVPGRRIQGPHYNKKQTITIELSNKK